MIWYDINMLRISGQMAGAIGLKFFFGRGVLLAKKIRIFFFFSKIVSFFHGQRRAFQLVLYKTYV